MSFNWGSLLTLLQNPLSLVQTVGYVGVGAIVFAETGLLIGFFLPGDSLLVATGLVAAAAGTPLLWLMLFLIAAAILGDAVGFGIGRFLGQMLYTKKNSFFFPQKHIQAARNFYLKHGGKTIILARFVPILRTFAPCTAGAAGMSYFKFALFNVIGGILWIGTMLLSGYYLGKLFGERINDYLHILIGGIILLSLIPLFIGWWKRKRSYVA